VQVDDGGIGPHGPDGSGGVGGDFATAAAWPTRQLTYGFVNSTPDLGPERSAAAFRIAFDVWAAAGFTFTEVPGCAALPDVCGSVDVKVQFDDPFTVCDAAFLGCAFYPGQGAISGNVHINDTYTWSDQPGYDPESGTYDLAETAIHEVGHAIGMRHTDPSGLCLGLTTDPVMCAFINRTTRDLHSDDLAGITSLYLDGAPANDELAAAEALLGTEGTLARSTSAATESVPDPACTLQPPAAGGGSSRGVGGADTGECGWATTWFSFAPAATGRFAFTPTLLGTGLLGVTVLEGPDDDQLTWVHQRVVTTVGTPVAFLAEQGRRYLIGVWNPLGDAGQYEATWQHQPGVVQRFPDVGLEHPFFGAIEQAAVDGLVRGYVDGTFRPGAAVTRQSMAAFLFRLSGAPVPTGCTRRFGDVSPAHPFFLEVCWAARAGVTDGYVDGTYRPSTPVSRQASARMIRRSVGGVPATGCESPFDVSTTHPFFGDICWLAMEGITTADLYFPASPLSRQAAATFFQRLAAVPQVEPLTG
jgi:hypothetical protein